MNMNYKIYMMLVIVVLSFSMGCIGNTNTDNRKISDTSVNTNAGATITTPRPTPTPTPIIAEPRILLNMSSRVSRNIGEYYTAKAGKVFLIYDVELENRGYQSFKVNPLYFKCVIHDVAYDVTTAHYSMDTRIDMVDILDGGKIKGTLAYEVPNEDQIQSRLFYSGIGNYVFETKK